MLTEVKPCRFLCLASELKCTFSTPWQCYTYFYSSRIAKGNDLTVNSRKLAPLLLKWAFIWAYVFVFQLYTEKETTWKDVAQRGIHLGLFYMRYSVFFKSISVQDLFFCLLKILPVMYCCLIDIREEMVEHFCSLTQWTLSWDQKRIGISWLVSIQLLMSIAATVVRCLGGNMNEHMKRHRSTRKESSYLRSQRSSRKTGNSPPWILWKCVDAPMYVLCC